MSIAFFFPVWVLGPMAFGQLTYSSQTPFYDFTGAGFALVQVADFNKDGYVDIVVGTGVGSGITYLQNSGTGTFSTPATNPFAAFTASTPAGFTLNNASTTVADYDGDGDLDIWCRVNGAGGDVYLRNDNGVYSSQTPFYDFTGAGFALVQVADFNKDGYVDIAVGTGVGSGITYLQNSGTGTFSTPATNPFAAFTASTPAGFTLNNASTSVADYDGDGDPDIWCRVNGAGGDVYLRNDNGAYSSQTPFYDFAGAGFALVQVADFNGDGYVDIAVGSGVAGSITYLQNSGTGAFSTPATNPFAAFTASTPAGFTLYNAETTAADFDGDGDLDIWCRVNGAGGDVYLRGSGEAPRLITSIPANNATNFATNGNMTLTFSEAVAAGTGNIYIRRLSDAVAVQTIAANSAAVTGTGTAILTINPPADLAANTTYYITFDRNAIADVDEGLIFGYIDPQKNIRVPYTQNNFLRFTTTAPLPVTLIDFTVSLSGEKALLEWQTATERNSRDFTIQYGNDGISWSAIGKVKAAGNSTGIVNYHFSDPQVLQEKNYYRLIQTDIDGKQTVSPVRSLLINGPAAMLVYPNPASNEVTVRLPGNGTATIIVYNNIGQEVYRKQASAASAQLSLATLPSGSYYLVMLQNGKQYTARLQHL
ncbi:FG-GAP-like repeat-containing protein [Taibaiella koreensis]|uniref:FG-GAP-like repeat-containing protein n=1 Tax=Taibaiella koreensis TaxID=1268548 RepID=UPI0013C308C4|nr:FG-GAP-like repeat-containing protein [Taibaiella koreensis]